MRWLVRFGYDGRSFAGWARQPGLRTVEGEIRGALARLGARRPGTEVGLDVASRTDRGVSALANALALRSSLAGATLLRQLNGIDPDLFFSAAAPIPEEFRVRAAVRRSYRYFHPGDGLDLGAWRRAAAVLVGELDGRSFGRGLPPALPCPRRIDAVTVSPVDGGLVIEVSARSFVWGMVRKMIGALREHAAGRLPLARLQEAARGETRLTLPMAEPEGLLLWNVEYPLAWTVRWKGPNRRQAERILLERERLWTRERLLEAIEGGPPDGSCS